MSKLLTIAEAVFQDASNIIDTHCHYNLEPFYPNWQPYWQEALAHGVKKTIIASTNELTSQRAVEIAQSDDQLFALVGVHPSEVGRPDDVKDLSWISDLLSQPSVIGIGEIGLDYYWLKPEEKEYQIQAQKKMFHDQLVLAHEHGGWLSLHIRDTQEPSEFVEGNAYWDAYAMMKEFDWSHQPFVLHCFSGSNEYVQAMLSLGAYVGVDGNITYPNAHSLRTLLLEVPVERILLETDAPYLAPQAFRGQRCQPWMIAETAKFLADFLKK